MSRHRGGRSHRGTHQVRASALPLAAFEGVQEALARIAGNAWLMDSARILTASAVDQGEKPSVLSAILKYHLTERGRECISHAMDVHGGKGIILGPNNYLGRAWQGAPIPITVEGANILSRNLMILSIGSTEPRPVVPAVATTVPTSPRWSRFSSTFRSIRPAVSTPTLRKGTFSTCESRSWV